MTLFITVLHVLVCIFLIVVVLLQRGKGAEVGAMFGGGGAGTMFGSRGASNLFTKLTTGSATVFMLTSLFLAVAGQDNSTSDLFDEVVPADSGFEETAPATSPFESSEGDPTGFEEIPADVPQTSEPSAETPVTPEPAAATPPTTG